MAAWRARGAGRWSMGGNDVRCPGKDQLGDGWVSGEGPEQETADSNLHGLSLRPLLLAFSNNLLQATNYFVRADIDQDGDVKLNDAVWILNFLFQGQRKLDCFEAADANDDGLIIITDPIFTLRAIFLGGLPFPPPSGAPGKDPTPDGLGCLEAR